MPTESPNVTASKHEQTGIKTPRFCLPEKIEGFVYKLKRPRQTPTSFFMALEQTP
jgi:hypothetical protein